MNIFSTDLLGVYILEPKVFSDLRGWFMESWSQKKMDDVGLRYQFVQDNHSYTSKKGSIRGLHFQYGDHSQAKLVRCVRGAVLDVAVDLRRGSPSYMKWVAVELSAENKRQLLIPRGFAHGFLTLTDDVEFMYKADNFYNPDAERSIIWNDPDIGINWGVTDPILSAKDEQAPRLIDCDVDFCYDSVK